MHPKLLTQSLAQGERAVCGHRYYVHVRWAVPETQAKARCGGGGTGKPGQGLLLACFLRTGQLAVEKTRESSQTQPVKGP